MNDHLLQTTSEEPVPPACYARNAERNPGRIEAQVRACRAYAEAHGLAIADEHVFVDDGASGANFDRPGWQALQRSAAADDSAFACVIVTEPSRVSRSADPNAHPTSLAEGRVAIRYVTGTDLTERPAVIPDELLARSSGVARRARLGAEAAAPPLGGIRTEMADAESEGRMRRDGIGPQGHGRAPCPAALP